VLDASLQRIEADLAEDDVVLDVGGWAIPLARADWVIDLMPFATRGPCDGAERFSAETWVQADICAREPWPFADNQFDFAICSHTLEDVRDPIWVCSELSRVARAGYVETPSRPQEQSVGVAGPFIGWSHHHWLVDAVDGGLEFVFKPHALHFLTEAQLTHAEAATMAPEERVMALFWAGELPARERIFFDEAEFQAYLAAPLGPIRERVEPQPPPRGLRRFARRSRGGSRRAS
jgi:hypothetical protein